LNTIKVLIGTAGTVIVAVLSLLGVILTRLWEHKNLLMNKVP
jgi:hypothetical protein